MSQFAYRLVTNGNRVTLVQASRGLSVMTELFVFSGYARDPPMRFFAHVKLYVLYCIVRVYTTTNHALHIA